MADAQGYVLGESERAARRLAIQDAHFGAVSEKLLDEVAVRPTDRVVELGCGPGGFSRRVLRRLGAGGVLIAVDQSESLLAQAREYLAGGGDAKFELVRADIADLGPWLDGADVVIGRTVLHHVPMAEFMLGRLRARVQPGTRVGFLEPDFRSALGRLTYLEAKGRPELAAFRTWAVAINHLYQSIRISPDVGASLARTLTLAEYQNVRSEWVECPSDAMTIENMLMFYGEVRDRLAELGILTADQVTEQQRLLAALPPTGLPAVWGTHRVAAEA
jgi:ubiquinone/menaquinone biosynthesis C-methylase UbiE